MFSVLTESVKDFSWPDEEITTTLSDGTSYTKKLSVFPNDCVGHAGQDVFPFGLVDNDVDDFRVQTGIKGNARRGGNVLTNREVLESFDPRNNALPYIYDTFEWPHCEADGYNMGDAWRAGRGGTG